MTPDWDEKEIKRLHRGWWLDFLTSWDFVTVASVVTFILIASFIGCN